MLSHSFLFAALSITSVVRSIPLKLQGRQAPGNIPDYVLKYAPIVYLHSDETFLPSDIQQFLNHVTPRVNQNGVSAPSTPLTVDNVDQEGGDIYLTSNDDVTKGSTWMNGVKPDASGKTNGATTCAVIINDKGNGVVDVFYMYFYAYNYGGNVLGWKTLNFGNHVGDWEHNMIRFVNGVPNALWYSQHANGQAFTYSVVEKESNRPVSYSAIGTHANYAMAGDHDHVIPNLNLPFGALEDHTNRGSMWDPLLSAWFYKYDAGSNSFTAYDSSTPTAWLNFKGHWGDQQYPSSDKRQIVLFGQAKFGGGPTGPYDKQLNRSDICPVNGNQCILRRILVPRSSEAHASDDNIL